MGYQQIKLIYRFFKTIVSVKTIMFVGLSGGLYYRIGSNRLVSVITAVYCIAACLYISSGVFDLIGSASTAIGFKVLNILITYYSCVIISLMDSEYFLVYLSDMESIDILLGLRPDIDTPVSRFLFLAVVTLQLGVALPFYWSLVKEGGSVAYQINFFKVSYLILTWGMTNFTRIMMFELLWSRVRMFRQYLENTLSRASRLQEPEDARNCMRRSMFIYKKILDTIKKSDIPVKSMIIVSVFTSVPKIMASVYGLISGAVHYTSLWIYELSMDLIMVCMPALLTALARGEVRRTKLAIGKQMLVCEDDLVREVLDDCVSYLEHRPCRYSVCRLFCVDVELVGSLLGLYVSYSLAMIQFGHFFN